VQSEGEDVVRFVEAEFTKRLERGALGSSSGGYGRRDGRDFHHESAREVDDERERERERERAYFYVREREREST
jgi:hypothetical protein